MKATALLLLLLPFAPACRNTSAAQGHHGPPPQTEALEPYQCGSIQRLHTYDGIFLASQPSQADFEQAKDGGVRTVLNIRYDREHPEMDEKAIVEGLGITYIHKPWSGTDELTDSLLDELRGVLRDSERPLLFHCHSANRVGAVWLAYRVLDGGIPVEDAIAEAKQVGLKSPAYQEKVLDYIRRNS